jgi:hypothetical protein
MVRIDHNFNFDRTEPRSSLTNLTLCTLAPRNQAQFGQRIAGLAKARRSVAARSSLAGLHLLSSGALCDTVQKIQSVNPDRLSYSEYCAVGPSAPATWPNPTEL